MAGVGKRLRPHTFTVPKPLIPIAGKPIVERLVEDLSKTCTERIVNIGFVIGDLDKEVKSHLADIAKKVGANPKFYFQEKAEGTGHAIACAADLLEGKVIIAYADTLFRTDFKLNFEHDGIIWTRQLDNPSLFGIVKTNSEGVITRFVEKPKDVTSGQAIIGIYYIKEGRVLKSELDIIMKNNIRNGGEFQFTTALEQMKIKGSLFRTGQVTDWLDCGNKNITVASNTAYLNFLNGEALVDSSAQIKDSEIIKPVFIGKEVIIQNSIVGPGVSIGNHSKIINSRLSECLIQEHTQLNGVDFVQSMIGNYVKINGMPKSVNLGDYCSW